MQNDDGARASQGGQKRIFAPCPPSDSCGGRTSLCPPYEVTSSERADRKIMQPQIGVAAFFPDPEQRPVQRLSQQVVALAHGDADALAEIAAFDEWAAGKGATIAGIGAVDPECQRNAVAEDEIDLAPS